MSTGPSAVVVGAGIVGAAVADALAQSGFAVLVLEEGIVAGGATGAGMGHIVIIDDSAAQLALTHRSRAILDLLAPELPAACELEETGTLWLAEDDDELEEARRKQARYAAAGVVAEVLDPDALREAEPQLRAGLAGALRVPGDSVVYPPALCAFLLDRARRAGAHIATGTTVLRLEPHAAVTARGRYEADVIVNCAGAAAPRLMPGCAIVPRKGHLMITDRYPGVCRHQLVEIGYVRTAHDMDAAAVAFNLQPRRTGQLLIGSTRELVGWDASINRAIVQRLLTRAVTFVPRLRALSVIRTWTGFRPATRDALPLIGRWNAIPGTWIAAGHEGLGITTALGTAQLIADLVSERTTRIDAAPYAPRRGTRGAA